MIELGLARVSRLLQQTSLSWKAIHVAGTNGKGSISAYLSHLLSASGLRCGRFTSPHLIDRWDCITINEKVVQESLFRRIEAEVKLRDKALGVGASEFELLTVTAFEIFNHERVEVGVVEVGMGGRLDATNVISNVLVSVISKIGLDHQSFLGNTIEEITAEKAGILKSGVPCVVDGSNAPEALSVLDSTIRELGIEADFVDASLLEEENPALRSLFRQLDLEPHQKANVGCALSALRLALSRLRPGATVDGLLPRLSDVQWPGRLQSIDLGPIARRNEPALLDGAHNSQSAEVLGSYVDRKLRRPINNVTWVIAASRGKDLSRVFRSIIKPGDNVAATAFGPVDGMPWVAALDPTLLTGCVQDIGGIGRVRSFDGDVTAAIQWACKVSQGGPLVIAGSLYLVSDVLRLLRTAQAGV